MMDDQTRRNCRRGATSCTECRRRKVRCIRSPEDAEICRRCEERGSACTAQIYSSQRLHTHRLSSRDRISQLETKVAGLSKIVRDMGSKLGYQPTQTPDSGRTQPVSSPGTDESDDNSSVSDMVTTGPPSHLRSLFQNDWLSVDTLQQTQQLQHRKAKASTHLLDLARHALQKLIPSKDEVLGIVGSSSIWLVLLHTLLPQPFTAKSQNEILKSYDEMHKPDVCAISLASWLLTLALTAYETPQDDGSPATRLKGYYRSTSFPRAISNIVESKIISHDKLICTIEGIGMAMHFCRLQINLGNFQKAWLRLRHFISIAELMGLPKSFQVVQLNKANGSDIDEIQLHRAQLWEALCSAEGLNGMVINIKSSVHSIQQPNAQPVAIDGVIQPKEYLGMLTGIANKIQYGIDSTTTEGSVAELYASTLELDRQFKVLASQAPKSWWALNSEHVKTDHLLQFLHYCVSMRVHLSFAMRQDPEQEYVYSRMSCKDACESVAERYQFLRRKLPSGFFLSQLFDLQAFTATVVLLLTSCSSLSSDRSTLRTNRVNIDSLVTQVIEVMDEKSKDIIGYKFSQHGVTTLRSLQRLLRQEDKASNEQELTLKIPLLGKVHVRRNKITSGMPTANNPTSSQMVPTSVLRNSNEQYHPQEHGLLPLNGNHQTASAFEPQVGLQWDPLTWSVENHYEDFFQDTLMAEEISPCPTWQSNHNDFQFYNS